MGGRGGKDKKKDPPNFRTNSTYIRVCIVREGGEERRCLSGRRKKSTFKLERRKNERRIASRILTYFDRY